MSKLLADSYLYRADPNSKGVATPSVRQTVRASREVILAAGTFNAPHLLKFSGRGRLTSSMEML